MDRIELDEELEIDTTKSLKPLSFDISRLKVKKVSNPDHAKKTALAAEIKQAWGIAVPRLIKLMNNYGYQFIQETFHQVQKNPNARNPAALFLWIIKQCQVEMKEVK